MPDSDLLFYEFNGYRLDLNETSLFREGKPVVLTQKSLDLLKYLVHNRRRVLNKRELLDSVWADTFVEETTLTSHIYMLRKALKIEGEPESLIRTVPKKGYIFTGEVKEIWAEEAKDIAIEKRPTADLRPGENIEVASMPRAAGAFGYVKRLAAGNALAICVLATAALFLAGLITFAAYRDRKPREINSIAVLPFRQINLEKEDKMGLGMADILINQLGRSERLRVMPTSSIAQFDGEAPQDPFAIGKQLEVDAVLVASSQCEDGVARVTYQLYDVRRNQVVMSEILHEKHEGVFSLQDRITSRIYERLSAELSGKTGDKLN